MIMWQNKEKYKELKFVANNVFSVHEVNVFLITKDELLCRCSIYVYFRPCFQGCMKVKVLRCEGNGNEEKAGKT
jgi:hypothetical protein